MLKRTPDLAYIYALVDPDTCAFRYVGQTYDMRRRYGQHLSHDEYWNNDKAWWIFLLAIRGKKPGMILLEKVPFIDRFRAEKRWTDRISRAGYRLANLRSGSKCGKSDKVVSRVRRECCQIIVKYARLESD